MGDPPKRRGLWGPIPKLALNLNASRLVSLSLQLTAVVDADSYPEVAFTHLPVLRTLRVMANTSSQYNQELRVRKIISCSPLLREIQYHFIGHSTISVPWMGSPTYSYLKVFKWTGLSGLPRLFGPYIQNATPTLFPPVFMSHAFQFDVVHLNPVPSFDILLALNMGGLVELRVDFNGRDDGGSFFPLLARAELLETLEVTGIRYWTAPNDPASLFPDTGLCRLRKLFLGIALEHFSALSLKTLASKTPGLHKLVLLIEPWNNTMSTRTYVEFKWEALSHEFQFSTANRTFSEWKIRDFGFLFRDEIGRIIDLEGLLMAIVRKVPSIASLYGTGGLRLWDGMENEIDASWGGELWNQRTGKW
ncbi:hypothetical protein DL96DRAFT_790817 [Flagelloscypha sp. PMI_526]|nr:hypothetical protein DL96DRAFT_790817 [Flagelloscypha sp. PMI_526]